MGEQKNDSEIFRLYSPSIFSLVKNKPYEIEYGYRVFKDFKVEELTYPLKESFGKATSKFPEYKQIQEAIDTCKHNSNVEYPFLLVSGDLSGIQDTVYTISSKGALKSLRARSFMLEFLCEHICYELVTYCFGNYKTYKNHIIFRGGGSFSLLIPNDDKSKKAIREIKIAVNEWAFEEFGGKLFVAIESIELNDEEVDIDQHNEKFKKKWNELSDKLEIDKKRKFNWKLNEIFDESKLKEPVQLTNKTECQICHRDDVEGNNSFYNLETLSKVNDFEKEVEECGVIHPLCYHLFLLGDYLTKADKIFRHTSEPSKNGYLKFPGITNPQVYFATEVEDDIFWEINGADENQSQFLYSNYVTKNEDLPEELKENTFDDFKEDYRLKHTLSFESLSHAKQNELSNNLFKRTADFENLALCSRGSNLIACLRMDVDNMGRILAEDLELFNLVTLANLSKMLNIFFKIYLNKICKSKLGSINSTLVDPLNITSKDYSRGRKVSIVYSGGDDLFVVGAWDEVAELAYDIQRCFKEYSGLGISGGLTLHKPNFPLYQMAKLSEEALQTAKTEFEEKNRITLFYSRDLKNLSFEIENNIREDLNKRGKLYSYSDEFVYHSLSMQEDLKRINLSLSWDDFSRRCKEVVEQLWKNTELLTKGKFYKFFDILECWYEKEGIYIPSLYWILNDYKNTPLEPIVLDMFIYNNIKTLHTALTWYKYLRR